MVKLVSAYALQKACTNHFFENYFFLTNLHALIKKDGGNGPEDVLATISTQEKGAKSHLLKAGEDK